MLAALIKSKAGVLIGSVLLILTVFYLSREFYQKYLIDQEIAKLEAQIARVEANNSEILELISYYKTTEYKERQARSILGLAKPGEFAVVLPAKNSGSESASSSTTQVSNQRLWWQYFFD